MATIQVDISARGFDLSEPIRQHVEDRLHAALDQHEQQVRRVDVVLEDTNGPKGGQDKRVKIAVQMADGDTVRVEQTGEELYPTVSRAADAVKHSVGKQRDRAKR